MGFALLIILDLLQVWHFFVFTFLSGIGWAINHPVRQTLVADTVPRHDLLNAVALITSAFNINRIIGPALGGVLIAFFGPANNFLLQAVFFGLVVVVVLPMRVRRPAGFSASRGVSAFTSFREGISYVRKEHTTLALILLTLIPSLFIMPYTTGLMPAFAKDVLLVGPDGLGLLLAGFGAGALVGPMILASIDDVRRKGMLLLAAGLVSGLGVVAFSQATGMVAALPALAVVGAVQMVYHTVTNTVLQLITPDEFRGRVLSLYMMDHGLVSLGAVLAGVLAQAYGIPPAILAGGVVATGLILVAGARFKTVRAIQ